VWRLAADRAGDPERSDLVTDGDGVDRLRIETTVDPTPLPFERSPDGIDRGVVTAISYRTQGIVVPNHSGATTRTTHRPPRHGRTDRTIMKTGVRKS
jgi:hypothetical protein